MLNFNKLFELKCGLKLGRKLADPDKKWAEKWFEVKCFDSDNTQIPNDTPQKNNSKEEAVVTTVKAKAKRKPKEPIESNKTTLNTC